MCEASQMTTFLYFDADCIAHDPGAGHPEQPGRLIAVRDALATAEFAGLIRQRPPAATAEQIARVHPRAHAEALLKAVPANGRVMIDADTFMSPGSGRAALLAAGAACAAVDAVVQGLAKNAFCAVRPPGHHAEAERAMGFCLFNNVAIAAQHARAVHGVERVAVADFDVHHGNGTQHSFAHQDGLFFASSHQHPFYPGSGAATETGGGNVFNAPLPAGAGSDDFRHAWTDDLLPALRAFAPEILIISAGFDGHLDDPLAEFRLTDDDYRWITDALIDVANESAQGRVVSSLEGGYDLAALGRSAAAHVRALMMAC
jgi:acetoin utilization deacetylase AcuC-like enzyme